MSSKATVNSKYNACSKIEMLFATVGIPLFILY